jgi:hypothetical protein
MSKSMNVVLAAALGFAVCAPVYAADASDNSRSTAWSDAKIKAEMDKCHQLSAAAQSKCIVNIRPTLGTTTAWTDDQISPAREKCNGLTGTAQAKCIVNIRSVTTPGYAVAMNSGTTSSDENVVRHGVGTEEEYTAAIKGCESADDRERCIANAKDHFGRM